VLTYDKVRRLTSIRDALNRVTQYQWCGCGALGSMIDPLGRVTTWNRDVQGRIISKVNADGSKIGYEYDSSAGWLTQIRDEQNQITKFDYNLDGTVQQKRYMNALIPTPTVKFTYDPDYLRLSTMEDGTGITTFTYNPITGAPSLGASLLASIDGPLFNDTISFQYDELGRVAKRNVDGDVLSRTWDAGGRVQQLSNALGNFTVEWDGSSRRLSAINYPNGQRSTYTYFSNLKDQLVNQITHLKPGGALLSRFTYDYNAVRQISDWTQERAGANPIAYHLDYDAADELTNAVGTQNSSALFTGAYNYDAVANLTNVTENGLTRAFSFNALNEPASLTNDAHTARSYEWDAAHRLSAFNQGTHRTEFSYDGFGRRTRVVEKESGGVVSDRRYVWCATELCEERDGGGTNDLKRYHLFGMQAGALADLPQGNYFYTLDHLFSVRDFTDSSGQSRAVYDYTPYGKRSRVAGDLNSDFGFTGFYQHAPSELNLALFRAYDANLVHWLSRDPLGRPEGNLYAYVDANPVNLLDRLGLDGADATRPDLLEVDTGNEYLNTALSWAKKAWDKTSWSEKTTKPAEEFYDKVEDGIEIYNDVQKVRDLTSNCGQENPSWKDLENNGHEAQDLFKTLNKWVKKLTSKIPGLGAVTDPVTDLGPQILDTGAGYIDESHGSMGGMTETGRAVLSGSAERN